MSEIERRFQYHLWSLAAQPARQQHLSVVFAQSLNYPAGLP